LPVTATAQHDVPATFLPVSTAIVRVFLPALIAIATTLAAATGVLLQSNATTLLLAVAVSAEAPGSLHNPASTNAGDLPPQKAVEQEVQPQNEWGGIGHHETKEEIIEIGNEKTTGTGRSSKLRLLPTPYLQHNDRH